LLDPDDIEPLDPERFRLRQSGVDGAAGGEAEPPPPRPAGRQWARRLTKPFSPVPPEWFDIPPPAWCAFDARGRLLLLLNYLSYHGTRKVSLTSTDAEKIGISRQRKAQLLNELEKHGYVRVERSGNKALIVEVLYPQ
jgi:hypothetical protein